MTILQNPPQSGGRHAGKRRYTFGHDDEAVRHTDAWEHETFAEEQARWERSDPEYARICEAARQARQSGEEASRRADEAKAEWDARVATQRRANDDAQKARHVLSARHTAGRQTASSRAVPSPATGESIPAEHSSAAAGDSRSGSFHVHTTFAVESRDSPAPGIIPESARVHDQPVTPTGRTEWRAAGRASKPIPSPGHRNPVRAVLAKLLSVIRGDKYVADAYPPAWHGDATTRDGDGLVHSHREGALRASPESPARPGPGEVPRAAPAELERKER